MAIHITVYIVFNVSAINAVPRPVSDQSSLFENTAEGVRTKDSGLPSDLTGQSAFKVRFCR